jgi:hypothetical protein
MWYKFRPVTMVLTHLAGEPVNNITGGVIHCSGTWNYPGKHRCFGGALYCIHIKRKQIGHYHEMSEDCSDIPLNERHKRCICHAV